jgi:hypothetical protein
MDIITENGKIKRVLKDYHGEKSNSAVVPGEEFNGQNNL